MGHRLSRASDDALLTSIYLVEYGHGKLAQNITFLVDVMTGIPSIVAGLFAYALFVIFFGEGVRMGLGGAVALSVLMIPLVVRSCEEMLKLVGTGQPGRLVEYGDTAKIFSNPENKATEAYISGRFG